MDVGRRVPDHFVVIFSSASLPRSKYWTPKQSLIYFHTKTSPISQRFYIFYLCFPTLT